jgi:hypothetical protein
MAAKGFCKKENLKKQFKKYEKLEKHLEDTECLKRNGIYYGNTIIASCNKYSQRIREKSEKTYGTHLIEARLLMITALADLQNIKAGIPGKTNESLGEILQLSTIFWQGQSCVERMISEGQYIKAAAVIKQDIEIIARIIEIKKGVAKEGKTPNAKHAPSKLNIHYGDMNDIAHISKSAWLDTLTTINGETFTAVSIQPMFHEGISKNLYEIHLSIFYNVILEAIELFQQLYPEEMDVVLPACKILKIVDELLSKSGFTSDPT